MAPDKNKAAIKLKLKKKLLLGTGGYSCLETPGTEEPTLANVLVLVSHVYNQQPGLSG